MRFDLIFVDGLWTAYFHPGDGKADQTLAGKTSLEEVLVICQRKSPSQIAWKAEQFGLVGEASHITTPLSA